jgi:dTDP-4-dehydrorhamnose reductase
MTSLIAAQLVMHYNGAVRLDGEKVAILGAGQVGRALYDELSSISSCRLYAHNELDILDAKALNDAFAAPKPAVIFHTAAFTKVNECERDPARAHEVNVVGTENVVRAAASVGSALVYFSTDYVFPGKPDGVYGEDDEPAPMNVYGKTKLKGEGIVAAYERGIIIRTAQVFAPEGRNFTHAVIANYKEQGAVKVVDDEYATPTYAPHLASAVAALLPIADAKLYHVRGPEALSYYDFAARIFAQAGLPLESLKRISSCALNFAAPRPQRAVLGMSRYLAHGLSPLPSLDAALGEFLAGSHAAC